MGFYNRNKATITKHMIITTKFAVQIQTHSPEIAPTSQNHSKETSSDTKLGTLNGEDNYHDHDHDHDHDHILHSKSQVLYLKTSLFKWFWDAGAISGEFV